jgi:tyrosine-protein phosphatase YwqE
VDRRFVDCHSHVVPSGDDGAATIQDGLALCQSAVKHGTAVLFATPHVWPYFTLSEEREAEIRQAYERMRPHTGPSARLRADARFGAPG